MNRSFENSEFLSRTRAGRTLVDSLRAALLALAKPHIESIDPNWVAFSVAFVENSSFVERDPDDAAPDRRIDLDFKLRAHFNGPERGSVDITEAIEQLVPEPLLALLRVADAYLAGQSSFSFRNDKHVVRIIPGRTLVDFENCEDGYVRTGDETGFEVEVLGGLGGLSPGTGDVYAYTLDQFKKELAEDGMRGQACAVSYLPLLDGIETPAQLLAAYQKQSAEWEAEHDRRRAEEEAAEAAAEAALTPEQRAEREAERERLAPEAALIRSLLQVLPGPEF